MSCAEWMRSFIEFSSFEVQSVLGFDAVVQYIQLLLEILRMYEMARSRLVVTHVYVGLSFVVRLALGRRL